LITKLQIQKLQNGNLAREMPKCRLMSATAESLPGNDKRRQRGKKVEYARKQKTRALFWIQFLKCRFCCVWQSKKMTNGWSVLGIMSH
jgi:hypothetical protein